MATHKSTRQQDVAYRQTLALLNQAMVLLDSVEDSLAAAQLSPVIELVESQVGPDGPHGEG